MPQWFHIVEGKPAIAAESREDRELSLLTQEVLMDASAGTTRAISPNGAAIEAEIRALIVRSYRTAEDSAGGRDELHSLVERTIIARALAEGMSQRPELTDLGSSAYALFCNSPEGCSYCLFFTAVSERATGSSWTSTESLL